MSKITIEKGIPMPPTPKNARKYPLDKMEIGDSFFIDFSKVRSVRFSSQYFSKKTGSKFSVRKVAGGYRCWRVK